MAVRERLEGVEALEGVGSAFAATRDGIDTMLRDRGLRRTSPELTAESLLVGAHASAALAGSTSSLDEVREGAADDIARASLRVSVELLGLVPVWSRTPLQALARLHAVAASGVVPDDEIGRPRDAAAAACLRDLVLLVGDRRPALVTAAVVHAELVTVAPFGSADGLVARAAERLVLAASGVDAKSLVVPEAGHLALRPAYESNLRGYAGGGRPGLQAWLLYCAEAYAAGAEASPVRHLS
ncbi:MAG: oxidoreductase [Nocardioides sp.]